MSLHFWEKKAFALTLLLSSSLVFGCNSLSDLKPVGQSHLSLWGFSVYSARSMSCDGQRFADAQSIPKPFALELTYEREISQRALIEATRREWKRLKFDSAESERWLSKLSDFWPSVKQGDELTLFVDRLGKSHFYLSGELIGSIDDARFGNQFVDIWLDEHASHQRLRQALLGREQ